MMIDFNTTLIRMQSIFGQELWLIELFVTVFFTALIALIEKRIFMRYAVNDTMEAHDDTKTIMIKALHRPLRLVIWVFGLYVALWTISEYAMGALVWPFAGLVKNLMVIVAFFMFSNSALKGFQTHFTEKINNNESRLDITSLHAIAQLLKITIVVTAALSVMKTLHVDITALVTFGGIGGIGIAFAAKELLANFFGGFMIFLDRPFEVGDWIRSPDKDIEGTVEYIGWRLTRIRTFDKRPRYVPNSVFLSLVIDNPSRMQNRRIKTNIGLRYADAQKIDEILAAIESMLRQHPEIDTTKTLMVNLISFGPSSLDFMIYTFTKTVNWVKFQAVQQDVFLQVLKIIEAHGAQCAFPTRSLIMEQTEEPTG